MFRLSVYPQRSLVYGNIQENKEVNNLGYWL